MSAAVDYYEERFEFWYTKWETTPRWRLHRRAIAWGRWKLYLELMADTITIEGRERDEL